MSSNPFGPSSVDKARKWIINIVIGILALKMLLQIVEPLLPVLIAAIPAVVVIGFLWFGRSRH